MISSPWRPACESGRRHAPGRTDRHNTGARDSQTSLCTNSFMTFGQSLTPASSTLWQPSGMPASASRFSATDASGVISLGVVEVHVHPQRVKLAQHLHQVGRDALRQEDRHARADADDLHVRDGAQAAQQILQHLLRNRQRVAAGEEHVTHLRRARDVVDLRVVGGAAEGGAGVADDAAARAVAAVAGALRRHQHEHAVGVAVHQPRHRRVRVPLSESAISAVKGASSAAVGMICKRTGQAGSSGVHEAGEVGRDVDAK